MEILELPKFYLKYKSNFSKMESKILLLEINKDLICLKDSIILLVQGRGEKSRVLCQAVSREPCDCIIPESSYACTSVNPPNTSKGKLSAKHLAEVQSEGYQISADYTLEFYQSPESFRIAIPILRKSDGVQFKMHLF